MLCAQCHTNRNYGGLHILSVVCYMLYQTDFVINFNINAQNVNLKSISSTRGGGWGGDEYISISSNAYSDLYDINSM